MDKIRFSFKDFCSTCHQICGYLRFAHIYLENICSKIEVYFRNNVTMGLYVHYVNRFWEFLIIMHFVGTYIIKNKCLKNITIQYIVLKVSVLEIFLVRISPNSYSVSLRIQSKCRKIRTRKTPNTDTFHAVTTIHDHPNASKSLKTNVVIWLFKTIWNISH